MASDDTLEASDVPLAGKQARHEVVEHSQGHPPQHMAFDVDSLDVDGLAEVARRERKSAPNRRVAEHLDIRRQEPYDLLRLQAPLGVAGDTREERVHAPSGRARLDGVERGE